jgi:predicted nucleotidyltransferase
MTKQIEFKKRLQTRPELELAVLIGSQANGSAIPQSDGGIAVRWEKTFMEQRDGNRWKY